MIPYDDLVAALTAWRARQGLPVAQSAAAPPVAPARKPAAPAAPAASVARQGPAAPPRARPPISATSRTARWSRTPASDAGDDYVMQLGGAEQTAEPTAIRRDPEPTPAGRGKRDKW